jgi:hypothetical protein
VWMRSSRAWMRSSRGWIRSIRARMRSSRGWMRSSRAWMRSSRGWMRSSRGWMRSSRVWMRSSRVVRTCNCQCRSRNCPRFDPSILRHSGIWGAADEALLNKVLNPLVRVHSLHCTPAILDFFPPSDLDVDVTRETREGWWPLLTVEIEANEDA